MVSREMANQLEDHCLNRAKQLTIQACELTTAFLATAHTKTHHTADHSTSPRYSLHFSPPPPIIFSYSNSYSIGLLSFYLICTVCNIRNRRHFWSHCFCPPFPVLFPSQYLYTCASSTTEVGSMEMPPTLFTFRSIFICCSRLLCVCLTSSAGSRGSSIPWLRTVWKCFAPNNQTCGLRNIFTRYC